MFEPLAVPNDAPEGLRSWLSTMLRNVADALSTPEVLGVRFTILHAAPARFENGDVVMADGVDWNPGGGAGLYARISGAWVKL